MTDQVPEFASPQEALAHYGVKGMKWGVRKPQVDAGGSSYTRKTQSTVDRLNRVASPASRRSTCPWSLAAAFPAVFRP